MMGDLRYGEYVPDGINPSDLSRKFLLSVGTYKIYNTDIFDKACSIYPKLYMNLKKVSKEKMSQRNFDKWAKYNMKITQDIFKNLNQ